MQQITYLITDEKELYKVDKLRKKVFGFENINSFYFLNQLLINEYKAYATKINGEIVAGCYFHEFEHSLIIEQLFVKESYQETGAKLGRKLLLELIKSKKELEKLLNAELVRCKVEPYDEKAEYIYKEIGFRYPNKNSISLFKSL